MVSINRENNKVDKVDFCLRFNLESETVYNEILNLLSSFEIENEFLKRSNKFSILVKNIEELTHENLKNLILLLKSKINNESIDINISLITDCQISGFEIPIDVVLLASKLNVSISVDVYF